MQDIIDFIKEAFRTQSRRKGVKLVKQWEPTDEDLQALIMDSVYYIQFQFHKITPDYDTGFSALTTVLMGCGEEIRRKLDLEDDGSPTFQDTVSSLGSVTVDALAATDYIQINRDLEKNTNSYEIQALDKWLELGEEMKHRVETKFRNIAFSKPDDITTHKHPYNRKRVVKRSTPSQFDDLLGSEHLSSLDKLQQTPWRVNKTTLEAALRHDWNDETPMIPEEGSKKLVDILYRRLQKDPSVQEDYNKASSQWENKRKALKQRSNIMERMMTLTKGSSLSGQTHLYNIMEFDYRGRMYYCEPYFHYQGNDLMKGLLEFGESRPVTDRGFYWLKLQAAACFNKDFSKEDLKQLDWLSMDYTKVLEEQGLEDISLDKMALCDREEWANRSIDFIRSVAHNKQIIDDVEYPVLFLATCIEIDACIVAEQEGRQHESYLPVAIDGSQNVLQHSSAINRDKETAAKVGLTKTDLPVDIYVAVGKRMVAMNPEFFSTRNMSMKDVRKNISKRSTMVRNYSAGRRSISENMFRDCVKNGASDKFNINPTDCFMLAGSAIKAIDQEVPANTTFRKYLQKLIIHELGTYEYTFEDGTDALSDWNKLFAGYNVMSKREREKFDTISRTKVAGLGNGDVRWTTPTGFPVIQDICHSATMRIQPHLMGKRRNLQIKYQSKFPDIESHKSAIAANFIHSQDATHAALTANGFSGNCFALVHDSFGVHASDVDELLAVAKVEFKKMYDVDHNYYQTISDNILSEDSDFNIEIPELGDLTFDDLDNSDYFFA